MLPRRVILSKQERALAIRIGVNIGIVLAVVATLPTIILIRYLQHQADIHHEEITAVAVLNCRSSEELKYQNRREAIREYNRRGLTIRLLKLDDTPELQRILRERKAEQLAQNRGRSTKCRNFSKQERLLENGEDSS